MKGPWRWSSTMSSFCSISLTLWPCHLCSTSRNGLKTAYSTSLFIRLSNKALPPRKCCLHLPIRFLCCLIPPSVGFWVFLKTPHHTKQTRKALWVSKTTYCPASYPTLFTQWFPLHGHWASRLDPAVIFSLRSPEQTPAEQKHALLPSLAPSTSPELFLHPVCFF